MFKRFWLPAVMLAVLFPNLALACACGCGVFDVGTGAVFPTDKGGTVWLEYNYMDQDQRVGNGHNHDRRITSDFITAGGQYMFNRSWGVAVQVPYWNRHVETTEHGVPGTLKYTHADLGDIRLRGIYTGFFDDMSTGVTFGLKLPTGDFTYPHFERDSQIGTGSTDIILGAFHRSKLTDDGMFDWFTNAQWTHAVSIQNDYRPGDEFNLGAGVYYNGLVFENGHKLSPILQAIGSHRRPNSGANSHADNSGYTNLRIGPGLEYNTGDIRLYGDVLFSVDQEIRGTQLIAPVIFKFLVGYSF